MQGPNLLGESPPADEPPPPEEPLGLDLIRRWLAKPRPRLRRLWLWVPYLAEGVQKAYGWLREDGGPALRKAATRAWALRGDVERLRARLEKAFPPGSRGRAVAGHLAEGSRLLLRSALLLVGIGREADRLTRVWTPDREPGKRPPKHSRSPAGTMPGPAPETPGRRELDKPAASSDSGQTGRDAAAASSGPARSGDPDAPPGPARSRNKEVSRPEPSPPAPSRPEPSKAEPSRENPPDQSSAGPAPADSSPVPGLPPGPRADALAKLSRDLRGQILGLGKRPRKATLRYAIWWILDECGERNSEELGLLLHMDPANLAKRHLSPLVEQGVLERTFPNRINHPEQAYRSTGPPPGADGLPSVGE